MTGNTLEFSTRERPGLIFDADGTIRYVVNGVSPAYPQLKFVDGVDWTYTLFVPVARSDSTELV